MSKRSWCPVKTNVSTGPRASLGCRGLLTLSNGADFSEYPAEADKRRAFISGFNGSAGNPHTQRLYRAEVLIVSCTQDVRSSRCRTRFYSPTDDTSSRLNNNWIGMALIIPDEWGLR